MGMLSSKGAAVSFMALVFVAAGACGGDDDSGAGPTSALDGGADGANVVDAAPSPDGGIDPACTDGVKGPGEADVDCGGTCAPCSDGKACTADSDCASEACENGACFPTAVCYASGFCFENPKPSGGWWSGAWGTAANNLWIAGDLGKAVRWNGKRFLAYDTGTKWFVSAIAGADATHVWTVGDKGEIAFFDGTKWTPQASGTTEQLRAISVSSAQNAWAVGYNGAILHWNGAAWSKITPNVAVSSAYAVYTTSANDVWVGGGSNIIHWNGATWAAETTGLAKAEAFWGAGGELWASDGGGIYRRDGGAWTPQATGLSPSVASGFAVDATHAYAVGYGVVYALSGSTWAPMSGATGSYRGVFGFAPNELWAVGTSGTIERFDGATWTDMRTYAKVDTLRAVAGSSPSNVLAVGLTGSILRRQGSRWIEEDVIESGGAKVTTTFSGVWTSGPGSTILVGGSGRIYRSDGATWKREKLPDGATPSLRAISGSSPSSIWVVGDGGASARYDGTKWINVPTDVSADLRSVWSVDATNAWAVGTNGTILHHDGVAWKPEVSPAQVELNAVWASDAAHAFIGASLDVDSSNLLLGSNGTWSRAPVCADGTNHYYAVAGHSPTDVWIGGVGGAGLWHYDGASVVRFVSEPGVTVYGIAAVGSSTFIVGEYGYILRRP